MFWVLSFTVTGSRSLPPQSTSISVASAAASSKHIINLTLSPSSPYLFHSLYLTARTLVITPWFFLFYFFIFLPASALLFSVQTHFFILGQSQGRTWLVRVCLEVAKACSVPVWPCAPTNRHHSYTGGDALPLRSWRAELCEKNSCAAPPHRAAWVRTRGGDRGKDNGTKLRRNLTSDSNKDL